MNWLRKLFGRRTETTPSPGPTGPRIVITTDGERLRVDVDWPRIAELSTEDINGHLNALVAMSHILTRGDGTGVALISEAIGHNARVRDEDEFGVYAIRTLNQVTEMHNGPSLAKDKPVLSPWNVFPEPRMGP